MHLKFEVFCFYPWPQVH